MKQKNLNHGIEFLCHILLRKAKWQNWRIGFTHHPYSQESDRVTLSHHMVYSVDPVCGNLNSAVSSLGKDVSLSCWPSTAHRTTLLIFIIGKTEIPLPMKHLSHFSYKVIYFYFSSLSSVLHFVQAEKPSAILNKQIFWMSKVKVYGAKTNPLSFLWNCFSVRPPNSA